MDKKISKLTIVAAPTADDARTINVVASTGATNAYGYQVDPKGWELTRFLNNPVVLYEHNAQAGMGWDAHDAVQSLPIGRAENVRVEDGALRCTIRFASGAVSELAERCYQAFREGMLNAVSVGFNPLEIEEPASDIVPPIVRRAELYELSVVGLPADANAVAERNAATARDLRRLSAFARTLRASGIASPVALTHKAASPIAVERVKIYGELSVRDRETLFADNPKRFRELREASASGADGGAAVDRGDRWLALSAKQRDYLSKHDVACANVARGRDGLRPLSAQPTRTEIPFRPQTSFRGPRGGGEAA